MTANERISVVADDFLALPDLALRPLGGAVVWATDDLFAEKENLIRPGPATYQPATFGHKGQVYDGWETRRQRGQRSSDDAIIRLGVPGIVRGVVVDTSWFKGNYPKIRSAGKPRIFSAGMERINFVSGVATAWGRGVAAACRCPALS